MPKKQKAGSHVDVALDISDVVLTTVRDAASLSTIPYFKEVAELALGILVVIQSTRDNREGFSRLATDACGLVYAILCTHQDQSVLQPRDLDNVRELLGTLASIERFAKKEASRNFFLRLFKYKSDQGKIQEYRDALRQSLDVFGLKSNISIQENMSLIAAQQAELVADLRERKQRETQQQGELTGGERLADEQVTRVAEQRKAQPQEKNGAARPAYGGFTKTSIGGDYITTDSSQHITNTNSGNTTTTTITDSNNDSSVRIFGAGSRGPQKGRIRRT